MTYTIRRVDATPNPNALKFVVEPSPGPTPRSYRSAPPAGSDPLAEAIFALPGVVNLLIHDGWITVSKSAETPWPALRRAVEGVLARERAP
ncbi:MAG: NifU N-terminal domain-containing protein [Phycisphaerales bacterium]|nr:NifU N-terminal domain-containing protein [Phycisphaerales bacterium]